MDNSKWKKTITLFLASQAITLFGSSLVQYAIIWYVNIVTQSGKMVSLMTLCGFLPQVLISLFAGVWADRYNRKVLIIAADAGIAVATLILVFIVINTTDFFWALLVISAVRSIGAGIQSPSVLAIIPQLVPQEKLMKISGINGSLQSLVNLAAPAVAGAVLSWGQIYYVMLIDVVTAIIGITVFLFIPVAKHQKALEQEKTGYFNDLVTGVKYVFRDKFLRRTITVCTVFCFLVVPACLLNVLFVTRTFGDEYWKLTLNEMAFFIGAVGGGFVIGIWGGFDNRLKTLGIAGASFGITTIAIGFVNVFWIYLIVIGLTGFTMPFNNTPLNVLIQEKVDSGIQGRVFSLLQIAMTTIMPLGMAVFGPIADVIPIQYLMIGSGIALLIMMVIIFRWKSFYKEGMKPVHNP